MSLVPDPAAFAALLCDWCLEVSPGQRIGVLSSTLGEELAPFSAVELGWGSQFGRRLWGLRLVCVVVWAVVLWQLWL